VYLATDSQRSICLNSLKRKSASILIRDPDYLDSDYLYPTQFFSEDQLKIVLTDHAGFDIHFFVITAAFIQSRQVLVNDVGLRD
jgi:hypothetical protein